MAGSRGAGVRGAWIRRAPACQSWTIASSRAKRRVRQAYIISIIELQSQYPSTGPVGTDVRSAASWALREEGMDFMRCLITNGLRENEGIFMKFL